MTQVQQQQRSTLSIREVSDIADQLSGSNDPVVSGLGKSIFKDKAVTHEGLAKRFNALSDTDKIKVYDFLREQHEAGGQKKEPPRSQASLDAFMRLYYQGNIK